MKLNPVFLVCGTVIILAVAYVSLTSESKLSGIRSAKIASPTIEKPIARGLAVKDGNEDSELGENLTDLTELGEEVAHLRAEVAALRLDMQTHQAKSATSAKNLVPDNPQALAEMRAKEDEYVQKQGEVLEVGFRQQIIDPEWSANAKNLVQEALISDKVAAKDIIDVECRATMCRVELANDANHQAPRIAEFPMKISEELPNILVNQSNESDGSTTTVLYLSKDDFVLPNTGS